MMAIALACRPRLLIADEPTTALDVTIQAQILDLMMDLRDEFGMAIIIITHNMGVVAETADRVLVMYAGRIVEEAPVARLFDHPLHPYTRGLLECVPSLDQDHERLVAIPGTLPDPARRPAGCRFAPRCRYAVPACAAALPPLGDVRSRPHCRLHPRPRSWRMTPLVEAAGADQALPGAQRRSAASPHHPAARGRRCRVAHRRQARRWAWSASPAAANPPWAAC